MHGLPIIRLEVESLKASILHAFSDYQLQFDSTVKAAVEKFCEPNNVQLIVNKAVDTTMREVIQSEVESFLRYGKGRVVLKEAVNKKLAEVYEIP